MSNDTSLNGAKIWITSDGGVREGTLPELLRREVDLKRRTAAEVASAAVLFNSGTSLFVVSIGDWEKNHRYENERRHYRGHPSTLISFVTGLNRQNSSKRPSCCRR